MSSAPSSADEAIETPAEQAALAAAREATGESGGPMERHGLRVFLIAAELASRRGLDVDREVLVVAGLLHDLGLYELASRGGVYVSDGAEFAAELLAPHAWSEEQTWSTSAAASSRSACRAPGFASCSPPCPATVPMAKSRGWSAMLCASAR